MMHKLFTSAFFALVISSASYAAGNSTAIDYGKEKPKNIITDNGFTKGINGFTLRSSRQFRGDNIINNTTDNAANYLNAKTIITANKSQSFNTITFKKGLIINSIIFNPNGMGAAH